MPRCTIPFIRRTRRLCLLLATPLRTSSARRAVKHAKIDDEERWPQNDHHQPGPIQGFRQRKKRRRLNMLLLILFILFLIPLLAIYTIYRPPQFLIHLLQRSYPSVIFQIPLPSTRAHLALTIDDAPSRYTGEILNLLKKHHAHATFFIIGSQVSAYQDVLQRIHDEGHEVGNHAWRDEPSLSLPINELSSQMSRLDALLPANRPIQIPRSSVNHAASWLQRPRYFRPGSGFFNREMLAHVERAGYRMALGSVYPHDPQVGYPSINARHVLGMKRPGSVIIMHDRRSWSVRQIQLVLEGLAREDRDWKVGSLGELLAEQEQVLAQNSHDN